MRLTYKLTPILLRISSLGILFSAALAAAESSTNAIHYRIGDMDNLAWLDSSREFIDDQADALASVIVDTVGGSSYGPNSANSAMRLKFVQDWNELDGSEFKIKLRGKVDLSDEAGQTSLVFAGEDGQTGNGYSRATGESSDGRLDLRFRTRQGSHSRTHLILGLRSGLKLRAGGRYAYRKFLSEVVRAKFSEELFFQDGEGFVSVSRFGLNRYMNERNVLSWSNRVELGEHTDGVEWRSRVAWHQQLNYERRLSYYLSVTGETDPEVVTRNYGVGARYRRSIFRPYLILEVEPAYMWRRDRDSGERERNLAFTTRLEVLF